MSPTGGALPKKILVAVDGSEESARATELSISLAKATHADLLGLHIIHLPEYVSDETRTRMRDELAVKGEASLQGMVRIATAEGLKLTTRVLDTTDSVVNAICEFASGEGAELVVLGTRGTGGVAKLMLGSVAIGVARSAKCPVLVVR